MPVMLNLTLNAMLIHPHKKCMNVTFQDAGCFLFFQRVGLLTKDKERKTNAIRALIFRQKMAMQGSIGSNEESS